MRLLSIDGWDLPCALAAASKAGNDGTLSSSLIKCERVLDALRSEGKETHFLEMQTPAVVVTENSR